MADDFDIVSDLSDGTADSTVSAHQGQTQHGVDAVQVNNQSPAREPTQQAKQVDVATEEVEKPKSVRELLSSALKGDAETPEASQEGPNRTPDGKFAPKPTDQEQQAAPTDAAPITAAPAGIDPAVFASLPAETQATLARTMDDVARQTQRFATLAPIEQLIAPRVEAWAINGVAPAQAIHQLFALSDFAGRDPAGFVKYFAQNNGVDLEDLVLGMDPAQEVDPTVKALQDQIQDLQGFRTQAEQQQQQAVHNRTVEQVIAFADEKDGGGQPLRPYLKELGETWLPYINMVKAQNPNWSHGQVLQQAYENACWNTPTVRGKMQAAANATAEAERLRTATDRATKARTAAVSVPTGAPTAPAKAPDDPGHTVRDTIRAAIAQHT